MSPLSWPEPAGSAPRRGTDIIVGTAGRLTAVPSSGTAAVLASQPRSGRPGSGPAVGDATPGPCAAQGERRKRMCPPGRGGTPGALRVLRERLRINAVVHGPLRHSAIRSQTRAARALVRERWMKPMAQRPAADLPARPELRPSLEALAPRVEMLALQRDPPAGTARRRIERGVLIGNASASPYASRNRAFRLSIALVAQMTARISASNARRAQTRTRRSPRASRSLGIEPPHLAELGKPVPRGRLGARGVDP